MRLADLKYPKLTDFTKVNIIDSYSSIEGGYVNNPNDRGGETNFGVTATTANQYKGQLQALFGWDGTMRNFTREMAYYVYDQGWWQRMNCDRLLAIHPFICDRVFDFSINGGRGAGVGTFQRILNVCNRQGKDYKDITVDGGLGNASVDALQSYVAKRGAAGIDVFVQYQLALQGAFYVQLAEKDPTQEEFVNGWGSRVTDIANLYARVRYGVA